MLRNAVFGLGCSNDTEMDGSWCINGYSRGLKLQNPIAGCAGGSDDDGVGGRGAQRHRGADGGR